MTSITKYVLFRSGKIAYEAALCILIIGVIVHNRILISKLKAEEASSGMAVEQRLHNLVGITLDGAIQPIATPHPGQKLLIIAMSPGCPACKESQHEWESLASALERRSNWRVIWVSRDPVDRTKEYFHLVGIHPYLAFADPPFRTYTQLGLRVVPRIIVVLPGGQVDRVWTGKLSNANRREVSSYFAIELGEAPTKS